MTECGQLADLLSQALQNRQDLNDPTYCEDFPDPEQCRKNLPAQKRAADQEIESIRYGIFVCSTLGGTWVISVDGVVEVGGHSIGQLTLTSWDNDTQTWSGTLSLQPEIGAQTTNINGTYSSQDGICFSRREVEATEIYTGTVDLSTQPLTMKGEMSLQYDPGIRGIQPIYAWSAQKQP